MSVTGLLYGKVCLSLTNKEIDLDTDTIKVALTTSSYTPNQDTEDYFNDITNEVTGTAYSAGGATLGSKTVTYTGGSNTFVFDAADTQWATSTITARNAIIYDASPGSDSTRPLIGYQASSVDIVTSAGNLDIIWSASGIVSIVVA